MKSQNSSTEFKKPPKDFFWYLGIAIAVASLSVLLLMMMGAIGYLLPMLVIGFAVAAPIQSLVSSRKEGKDLGAALLEGLRGLITFPALFLGIGAPCRTIMWAGFYFYFLYRYPEISFPEIPKTAKILFYWAPFEVLIAICGIAFGIIIPAVAIFLIFRQARLVEDLATSKARSAALGIAEFKGIARRVEEEKLKKTELTGQGFSQELESRGIEPILFFSEINPKESEKPAQRTRKLSRFYLEDDTGRILVDPTGAQLYDPESPGNEFKWMEILLDPMGAAQSWWGGSASVMEPVCKILLTRRVLKSDPPLGDTVATRELLPGDPVYVLGNVEMNPEAPRDAVGSDRLIVRPSTAPVKRDWFNWIFSNSERFTKSRDYRYIFLVSDAYEYKLREILFRGIYIILVPGTIGTAGSLALLLIALKLLG